MKNVPLKQSNTTGTYPVTTSHRRTYTNPVYTAKISVADALRYGISNSKRATSNTSGKTGFVNKSSSDNKSQSPAKPRTDRSNRMGTPTRNGKSTSKFGGYDECTRINYKSGELKMEKFINRKDNNL